MNTLLPFLSAAAVIALMPAAAPAQPGNAGTMHAQHIVVSVTDAKGVPARFVAEATAGSAMIRAT